MKIVHNALEKMEGVNFVLKIIFIILMLTGVKSKREIQMESLNVSKVTTIMQASVLNAEPFVLNVMIMEHAHLVKMVFMLGSMKLIMFIKFNVCFVSFHAKHVLQLVSVLRNMTLRTSTQILLGEENVMKDNLNPKVMESVFLVEKAALIVTSMVFAYNVKLLII